MTILAIISGTLTLILLVYLTIYMKHLTNAVIQHILWLTLILALITAVSFCVTLLTPTTF